MGPAYRHGRRADPCDVSGNGTGPLRIIDGSSPRTGMILLIVVLLVVTTALIVFGVTAHAFIYRLLTIPIS